MIPAALYSLDSDFGGSVFMQHHIQYNKEHNAQRNSISKEK